MVSCTLLPLTLLSFKNVLVKLTSSSHTCQDSPPPCSTCLDIAICKMSTYFLLYPYEMVESEVSCHTVKAICNSTQVSLCFKTYILTTLIPTLNTVEMFLRIERACSHFLTGRLHSVTPTPLLGTLLARVKYARKVWH
jgi:hypothetical protein